MTKLRGRRDAVLDVVRRHGGRDVRVFGSVVRGEDGPDSDIDLLIDLDVHRSGLLPTLHMADELSQLLDERVDVVARQALDTDVARATLDEAVAL